VKNKVGYGIIGAGNRPKSLAPHLLSHKDILFKGIFDPSQKESLAFIKKYGNDKTVRYSSYQQLIDDPDISWVLVCSPNYCHKEHILASFAGGKHVFAEKPLATTIEDCVAIDKAHKESGLLFATGFVLRYSPMYRKAKSLLDSGIIGKAVSIEANENDRPEAGASIMTNWRRFKKFSGPYILEKCCHEMDLLNWYIGSLPSKVASFGGLNVFTEEHAANYTMFTAPPGLVSVFHTNWGDITSQDTDNPFTSEKDIVDNQVAILEYRNHVRVVFRVTTCNPIPERRMYFTGTEGNLIVELCTMRLAVKRIGYDEPTDIYDFGGPAGHAGGDKNIVAELVESMINNTAPASSGSEGLLSAVVSLSLEKSRVEGCMVDIEPVWDKLSV
jgi:predicted dehydrogenase